MILRYGTHIQKVSMVLVNHDMRVVYGSIYSEGDGTKVLSQYSNMTCIFILDEGIQNF